MPRFRKKPVEVVAEQFLLPGPECPKGSMPGGVKLRAIGPWIRSYQVETLHGWVGIKSGDWILLELGPEPGKFYTVDDEVFHSTYEPVLDD